MKAHFDVRADAFRLAKMLTESAIDYEVAEARGYWCTKPYRQGKFAELAVEGFGFSQRRAGVILPLHSVLEDGHALCQLRPWTPREPKNGKPVKYETPTGKRLRLDCHPFSLPDLAEVTVPLWITEGIKKADAAVSAGLCCIAILGVEGWRNLDHEWNAIALQSRKVFIAFDSDAWSNSNVLRAQTALTEFLVGRGAQAFLVRLPAGTDGAKVGLDDYLAAGHSAADLEALAESEFEAAVRRETRLVLVRAEAHRRAEQMELEQRFRLPVSSLTLVEEMALVESATQYLIDRLHVKGTNSLIAAIYKIGKTVLMNNLMRSLATGEPFLGELTVTKPVGRIALWNYELGAGQIRRWFKRSGLGEPSIADRCAVWNLRGESLPLQTPFGEDLAVKWLQERDVEVLILDPLMRAFRGAGGENENDNSAMGRFLDTLDRIKARAGVSDLFVPTHFGRASSNTDSERSRGATVIDDWADGRWIYTKDASESRYLRAEGRDVFLDEKEVAFDEPTLRLTFTGRGSRAELKGAWAAAKHKIAVLQYVVDNPGCSAGEIDEACGLHSSLAAPLRQSLVKEGALRTEADISQPRRKNYYAR